MPTPVTQTYDDFRLHCVRACNHYDPPTEPSCSICMDEYDQNNHQPTRVRVQACSHTFCRSCLEQLFDRRRSQDGANVCPLCRTIWFRAEYESPSARYRRLIGESRQSVPLHPGPGTGPPPYFTNFTPSSSGSATPSEGPQPPQFPPQRSVPVPTPASDRTGLARLPSMNGGSVHLNALASNHTDISGHEASLRGRERALLEKQANLDRRAAEIADGEASLTRREAASADIVDRELAVARRQEQLDIRDAILQSRASQMTRLEAGTEKLKRVDQHLNAREASLNYREAIHGGHDRREINLQQRETALMHREAEHSAREIAVHDVEHLLQVKEAQMHQQAESQQRYLSDREAALRRRLAEVDARELALRDAERQLYAQVCIGDDASSESIATEPVDPHVYELETGLADMQSELESSRPRGVPLEQPLKRNPAKEQRVQMREHDQRQQNNINAPTCLARSQKMGRKLPGAYDSDEDF